jgi:hypothetical protein
VTKALAIAKRDLRVLFGGPLAWTVIGAFTFLAGYFFYTDVTFYVLFGGGNLPTGLWRYVFMHDRLVALLVLPLITMRLVAEERKLGTLELLWSLPIRDREVLAGKLLAAVVGLPRRCSPDRPSGRRCLGPAPVHRWRRSSRGISGSCCSARRSSRAAWPRRASAKRPS